jgi:hypothetical protein
MTLDNNLLDFSYHDDLMLTGNGGISQDLIPKIAEILEDTFHFYGINDMVTIKTNGSDGKTHVVKSPRGIVLNSDVERIKPFLDGEAKESMDKHDVKRFKDKYVYIVQYSKVFDHRLVDLAEEIERNLKENYSGQEHSKLWTQLDQLKYLALPDMKKVIAPRFMSSRFNPSVMKAQLQGQIYAVNMGEAKHIGVVMPKTIFELSHHFREKWREKDRYEMPAFQMFLDDICMKDHAGAKSIIMLHPHAPREGLKRSRELALNYVMMYPQTFTLSSNGQIYSIDNLFERAGVNLSANEFDPIRMKINKDISDMDINPELKHLYMYFSSVDEGGYENASRAANRFGLKCVRSLKDRAKEGSSSITKTEELEPYLMELKNHSTSGKIVLYIVDDMLNLGGSANKEAHMRRKQIADFNAKYKTNYEPHIEVIISHLRGPEVGHISHDALDGITTLDTVPYVPSLQEQASKAGFGDKLNIIGSTPHLAALGIAFDYLLQRIHYQLEWHLENRSTPWYRDVTDKDLVRGMSYGQDLHKMTRHIDSILE